MIKIAIADDHQLFLDGIKMLLKAEQDLVLVGEAADGLAIQEVVRQQAPDVVLLDINMPQRNGKEATKVLKKEFPQLPILILTMHAGLETITEVMDAGASGYMLKNASKAELITAIRTIHQGKSYYSNQVTDTLIEGLQPPKTKPEVQEIIELTRREKEVIALILKEHTTQEIAAQLFVAESTVITHRKNLLRKTDSRNTAGLVQFAIKMGWDQLEKED